MNRLGRHRPTGTTPGTVRPACLLVLLLAVCGVARGQERDEPAGGEPAGREVVEVRADPARPRRAWAYPTQGPSGGGGRGGARSAGGGSWRDEPSFLSVAAGPAWFSGDNVSDSPDFAAEVRLAHDLSEEAYLVGSYLFTRVETETDDGVGGPADAEDHDLHVLSVGVGLRADVADSVGLFIEPRVGVLLGGDAETAPVGSLTGGVELRVNETIGIRFAVTGLITDSSIDTDGEDAELDGAVMGTVGVTFEF